MKILILFGCIFGLCNARTAIDIASMVDSMLEVEINSMMSRVDSMSVKIDSMRTSLRSDIKGISVNRHAPFSTASGNAAIFDAYTTSTGNTNNCGQQQITAWTQTESRLNSAKATAAQQFVNSNFVPVGGAGFYYVHTSFTCSQGSICDMNIKTGGTVIVAGLGNRENNGNANRWAQMTQGFVHRFNLGTTTMGIFMAAGGGGFGTQNCYRETGMRYGKWSVFLIRFQ